MRDHIQEAQEQLGRSQGIADYMTIPSQLQDGQLNDKTQPHTKLAQYDHSLEMNRLTKLREEYGYVEPEPIYVETSEVKMDTESYNNIAPEEVPNLNGLFDDVFGLDS